MRYKITAGLSWTALIWVTPLGALCFYSKVLCISLVQLEIPFSFPLGVRFNSVCPNVWEMLVWKNFCHLYSSGGLFIHNAYIDVDVFTGTFFLVSWCNPNRCGSFYFAFYCIFGLYVVVCFVVKHPENFSYWAVLRIVINRRSEVGLNRVSQLDHF